MVDRQIAKKYLSIGTKSLAFLVNSLNHYFQHLNVIVYSYNNIHIHLHLNLNNEKPRFRLSALVSTIYWTSTANEESSNM